MTTTDTDIHALLDTDASTMTREELIAHNLRAAEAHFHNENPNTIDKAPATSASASATRPTATSRGNTSASTPRRPR